MKDEKTVSGYIAALPPELVDRAEIVRQIIKTAAPQVTEAIKYGMPAFQIAGTSFLYFAVWRKHIGIYPVYVGTDAFEELVKPFRAKKDTVQFLHAKPLPTDVIAQIAASQRDHWARKNRIA